jgi:diaminopimelate decarboxylase
MASYFNTSAYRQIDGMIQVGRLRPDVAISSNHQPEGREPSLMELTKAFRTPFFFYNLDHIRSRFSHMQRAYRDHGLPVSIHYATKANCNPRILRLLAALGAKADVVSLGETTLAIEAGFSRESILFSGVAKTVEEIKGALNLSIGQINVESLGELERLAELAKHAARSESSPFSVGLRLNPNVCPETHPYITTGLQENKFGMDVTTIREAVQILRKVPWLRLRGLSLHIGSQLLDLSALDEAIEAAKAVQNQLRIETGWKLDKFDVGGGLGIKYEDFNEEEELGIVDQHADLLARHLRPDIESGALTEILTEPGRWLVARSGVLVTEIQYVKTTPHKTFVITDGGMNLLIRPALYSAEHRIEPLERRNSSNSKLENVDVVGPICESADFLGRNRNLGDVQATDRIAVFDAGAYGRTMASLYNQRGWPDEYVFEDGHVEKANVSN